MQGGADCQGEEELKGRGVERVEEKSSLLSPAALII
jgi:hypothetical protein